MLCRAKAANILQSLMRLGGVDWQRTAKVSEAVKSDAVLYVEPRKMVQMNWFAGQKLRHRCREQTYGHQGGKTTVGWGWWCAELGDWD